MNRREVLLSGAALASAAFVSNVQAAEKASTHQHHHTSMAQNSSLLTALADCIQKGQVCLSHCLQLLGEGEKELAGCAQSVNETLAICTAMQQLTNQNSAFLPKLAKIAMDACKKCEDECKKHEKHESCKACGESCAACYKECKKIAA